MDGVDHVALYAIHSISKDQDARKKAAIHWLGMQTHGVLPAIAETEFDGKNKIAILTTVYNALYSELRDKDGRLQQVVSWGFTLLSGAGIFALQSLPTPKTMLPAVSIVIGAQLMLGLVGVWLSWTIRALSTDRMSIARQLDRIHQVFGVFKYGMYCQDTTLFSPMYYGWGLNAKFDANHGHARAYTTMLLILCVIDWGIISLREIGPVLCPASVIISH
jgi:hypothetical protein